MAVNSIPGDVAAYTLQPAKVTAPLDQTVKVNPPAVVQASHSVAPSSRADTHNGNTDSAESKRSAADVNVSSANEARSMRHVVVEYNMKGNIRVKFMDSHNNITYQIPSEMVAKIEDQMLQLETATSIKG